MADGITAKVEGLRELEANLKALTEEVAYKSVKKGALAGAEVIRKEAARIAPRGEDEPGDGERQGVKLFKSIFKKVVKDKKNLFDSFVSGSVHVKIAWRKRAFWGLFNEFGTSKMAAQPFMRPALDTKRQQAIEKFIAAVKDGMRQFTK
jgi:HK97 gp10 family phage protein